jgi:hypothetical protein
MPGENHSLDRRNKTHRNVIDVMVRNITPMHADLKRPYVISAILEYQPIQHTV